LTVNDMEKNRTFPGSVARHHSRPPGGGFPARHTITIQKTNQIKILTQWRKKEIIYCF
jgi:hypothetical protein